MVKQEIEEGGMTEAVEYQFLEMHRWDSEVRYSFKVGFAFSRNPFYPKLFCDVLQTVGQFAVLIK